MNSSEAIAYLDSLGLAKSGTLISPSSVQPENLIPICDDYLSGELSDGDLQEIARVLLERPDHNWKRDDYDPQYDYDERVERSLVEWYAPEIYFPVSRANIRLIRGYLAGDDWKPMTKS